MGRRGLVMDSCYWGRLSRLSGDLDHVIANENAAGSYYVTLEASAFALETEGKLELAE